MVAEVPSGSIPTVKLSAPERARGASRRLAAATVIGGAR
jgi:hypothetical protein